MKVKSKVIRTKPDSASKRTLTNYGFVVTILWIGFIVAISFVETPLRFAAEDVTLSLALQIGRLVFHALNYFEIGFAVLILCCILWQPTRRKSVVTSFFVALIIVVIQTAILFAVLDSRTNQLIDGVELPSSPFHTICIALEFAKLVTLAVLAWCQIRDWEDRAMASAIDSGS